MKEKIFWLKSQQSFTLIIGQYCIRLSVCRIRKELPKEQNIYVLIVNVIWMQIHWQTVLVNTDSSVTNSLGEKIKYRQIFLRLIEEYIISLDPSTPTPA